MKYLLFSILIAIASISYSQTYDIKVKAVNESFSVGNKDALSVKVYESDLKKLTKAWKTLMKDYETKAKGKEELFADDAKIKNLSSNTCDIYTKFIERGENIIEVVSAVDLGGAFLSKSLHAEAYPVYETILRDFAVEQTKEGVKEQVKDQEKVLSELEKDLKKLGSKKENLEEDIEDYKQKIKDAEEAIEKNKDEQLAKNKEIETQKVVVKRISDTQKAIK